MRSLRFAGDAEAGLVHVLDGRCRHAIAHGNGKTNEPLGTVLADPGNCRATIWMRHALDIRVSPAARSRALRLLDALLNALEARGYSVSARGVTIEGELVPIGVMEKDDRAPHVATAAELARKRQYSWERIPTWDYAPSGRLSIFTDAYVWWRKDLAKAMERRAVGAA